MTAQMKNVSRRMLEEVFSTGALDVIDQLVSADFALHDPTAPPGLAGPSGMRAFVSMYRSAFPDLRITIDEQLAEGDRVVSRWTARGTHRGPLMNIPATNKSAVVTGITIDRHIGGKIVEAWTNWDSAGLFAQLGITPPAPRPTDGHGRERVIQR